MSPRKQRLDDWIDDDEYPDDKDVEDFGDESPADYDPRTIGSYGNRHPSFWTRRRLFLLIIIILILAALLLPQVIGLLR